MAQLSDGNLMIRLREALAVSWDKQTAYQSVEDSKNPALGQCYPTSRVVHHYFPHLVILKGIVWNGVSEDTHFWNALKFGKDWYHIDFTWQQFPSGSTVQDFSVHPVDLPDSEMTKHRCALLLQRVEEYLLKSSH